MDHYLRTARILLIDDELANLKLLDRMLDSQGYCNRVLIQDPRDVVRHYQEAPVDLLLLDINMPHLNGFAVMEQLSALSDPVPPPIVILTAQHDPDYLHRALNNGARDFITKPFNRGELLARVRNLLDAHLAHRLVYEQKTLLEVLVQERTEQIHQTRLQVIRSLGRAAEYRDNETGYHILRMSQYSALLAKSLGCCQDSYELMLHASPMHDVGKIGIPDAILLKPGKFEPHEWEIMKNHTLIGAEILQGGHSDLLKLARTIALTHHEKWDGSGYPSGLSGTDIPQAGRIVAVADVFDALISNRPYKKAWPVDDAVAFMNENAGSHFDPDVIEHFQRCLPEIIAIHNRYLEPEKCS